jgi:hypothetical protein
VVADICWALSEDTRRRVRMRNGTAQTYTRDPHRRPRMSLPSTIAQRDSLGDVTREFRNHADMWKREMRFVSSLHEKYLHPSYARIIGIGEPAVPLILRSLQREPDDWFYALRAITGDNPVPASAAGNMREMTDAWLQWGRARGLI